MKNIKKVIDKIKAQNLEMGMYLERNIVIRKNKTVYLGDVEKLSSILKNIQLHK